MSRMNELESAWPCPNIILTYLSMAPAAIWEVINIQQYYRISTVQFQVGILNRQKYFANGSKVDLFQLP